MTWVMAGVAGVNLLSGLSGAKKKKKQQAELQNYQRSLRLDPVTGQFGGISVNDGNVDGGQFGALQNLFSGGAGDVLGSIDFASGLPPEISQALGLMQSRLQPNVNPMLGGLRRGGAQAGILGGQAFGDVAAGGAGQGDLMARLFSGASGLAGDIGQGFGATRDSALSTMRSAALPEQQRAVDSTLSRLFAQGRLGSTGGANIIGRLAEAQNQQDLGFQMAAGDEARAASADTMGRFNTLFSGGQNALAQAFGRFSGATGMGADLSQMGFERLQGLEQEGFSRLGENLQAVTGAAGIPTALQSGRVGLANTMLGSAGSIQDMLMQAFGGALNRAQAGTNVRVAGAGLNAQSMQGADASPVSSAFQSFTSGMLPAGGLDIASLFSKIGQRRQPSPDLRNGSWG